MAPDDVFVLLHMAIDRHGAGQKTVDVLADTCKRFLNLAPVRPHSAQKFVTPLAGGGIG